MGICIAHWLIRGKPGPADITRDHRVVGHGRGEGANEGRCHVPRPKWASSF